MNFKHVHSAFLLGTLLTTCMSHVQGAEPASSTQSPNIVILYVDNVGFGDLGCYGNTEVLTPHLDQLAAEGVRCTDFYVVTSSCTPSRGALLTGRYPRRNGLMHQLARDENWYGIGLPQRERLLPQYLKDSGYATGCFGKWNIGFAPGSRPTERGFDEFLGFRSGNIHYYKHL
jgi:arylsulfatase A